jgi:hypothetical protein
MLKLTSRLVPVTILLVLVMGSTECQSSPVKSAKSGGVPVGVTGIDYLADHLSVQRFNVNGLVGGRAGTGGSTSCCATLPEKWQPNMAVKVTWNVTNWRDCSGTDHEATVPVEQYAEAGRLYISFLPGNEVRAVSSALDTPRSPGYLGPKQAIPKKQPWKKYPPREHCPNNSE